MKPNRKLFSSYTFTCFDEIKNVPEADWTKALKNKNVFLSHSYLSVLHKEKNEHFRFRYVIIYNRKNPIGVVYFQINDFPASLFGELIEKQITELKSKRASVFQRYIDHNEDETIMRLVTCGNNFISGEHGFYIDVNSKKTTFKLVEGVIDCVSRAEKLRGKISAILVKDFYEEGFGDKDCWYCTRFKHFNVEPNMIIDLPKGISNLTDYINCFSKKYRNRAKGILKASASLTKKRLSNEEVSFYKETMHALYTQVFNQAKFKLAHLSSNYFEDVVKANTNSFYVDAWFLEDKMLSFACGFCLENEVEAHYIGFDYAHNKEFELYQTILYSFIEQAILMHKAKINLGRTASEIKTTVGAKPHELLCYIKPQNTVSKLILKPFMQFLQPTEWIPRNPFKEEA
ncbi:MAG: hypothetical protein C0448_08650 [Sphingobacteriaceae bacterium]|nr:hypothetical protein [Sphingobacteriaceae bacterium]